MIDDVRGLPINSRALGIYSSDDFHEILQRRQLSSTESDLIKEELQRRHLRAIADQVEKLNSATEKLIAETTNVHQEVGRLTASSERLEKFTLILNRNLRDEIKALR
jgi:hypothetical protein